MIVIFIIILYYIAVAAAFAASGDTIKSSANTMVIGNFALNLIL
jgi:hypothetical protein